LEGEGEKREERERSCEKQRSQERGGGWVEKEDR
jgi:hypothetical protein